MGKMKRSRHILLFLVGLFFLLFIGAYSYYKWLYPFGFSHNFDTAFTFSLSNYASDHGGKYPDAGDPSKSLALLIPDYVPATMLAGKSIPSNDTAEYYEKHGTLSESICGWGYFPGLSADDSNQLLLWDKVALSHNGRRVDPPYRTVILTNGFKEKVYESKWIKYFKEQKKAWENKVQQGLGQQPPTSTESKSE